MPLYLGVMAVNLSNSLATVLFTALALVPFSGRGQYALDYGISVGTANYLGDIGGDFLTRRDFAADLHVGQTKVSSHVFARYRISNVFSVRAQLGTVYLEDYDNLSTNPARQTRNAHFRNFVNEISVRGELTFFSRPMITRYTSKYRVGVNTYATVGVTGFTHNPQAQLDRRAAEYHYAEGRISTNPNFLNYDQWFDLREVQTEKLTYGSAALGFPMGLGASFMINYEYRLGLEFVWNLTLTDYIDDVSFTYADPSGLDDIGLILSQPSSPALAESAGVEDADAFLNNFRWDASFESPRGNPDKNDTYGTLQLSLSKVVMGSSNFRRYHNYNKRRKVNRKPTRKRGNSRMGRGRAKF